MANFGFKRDTRTFVHRKVSPLSGSPMSLLPRKGILAITVVVDIAVHARGRPITGRMLSSRYGLPPRHFEPVLQALVRHGILRGIRGPRGGYELARDPARISADDIVRAAGTIDEVDGFPAPIANLIGRVVIPALGEAEHAFSAALARINLENLASLAEGLRASSG
jgi:Rrf2 family transcriptional regulator, iron-sulfur cluster assembly transcription factor